MAQYRHRDTRASTSSTMESFITFQFWLGVFAVLVTLAQLAWSEYPRPRTPVPRGGDVIALIDHSGIALWAYFLTYGAK